MASCPAYEARQAPDQLPQHFRDYFKARYGPVVAAYQRISDDPEKAAALDRELAELAQRHDHGATTTMDWEYLLVTARKQP